MTLDEILALFPEKDGNPAGNGYNVTCPSHDDKSPSLSVTAGKKGIVMKCQAKCGVDRICKDLGITLADLFFVPVTQNGSNGNGNGKNYDYLTDDIIAIYDYKNEIGTILYQCVKYDTAAQKAKGRKPAKCRMRKPGNYPGYYKWNLDNVRLIPYRLPELLASDPADYVFIVEGEKDVENAKKNGLIATCNPTGAGKWQDEYSAFLANRICIIIPDNDKAGRDHADDVFNSLTRCAPGVTARILDLQGLPAKGDLSDWFNSGHTADELKALADAAIQAQTAQTPPPIIPPASPSQQPQAGQSKIYNTTDMGNAERFSDKFGDITRYCSKLGKEGVWLIWDGKRWQIDEKLKINRMAKQIVPDIYADAIAAHYKADKDRLFEWGIRTEGLATRNNMVKDARPSLAIAVDELDTHPWLLNVKNGTIDLRAGKLTPHSQTDYLTKTLQIDYDENAICPTWIEFINSSQWDKQEAIDYLQKAVGYSLTGDVREKCMFILHGPKDTGKSTFVEAMQMLLGEYAIKIQTQTLMWRRERQQSNDIAILKGARFVHASEAEEHERLAEAQIKELTGGDTVTCRFLHAEFFQFQPEFKLWLSTNHKPKVSSDKATWGRLKLIPFTYQLSEDQKDKMLKTKLRNELSGILTWAVKGCLRWQAEGLAMPQTVTSATGKYQDEMDVIGQFIAECCDLGDGLRETSRDLYATYKQWASDAGEYVENQRSFGLKLKDRNLENQMITSGINKGRTEWLKISLRQPPGRP